MQFKGVADICCLTMGCCSSWWMCKYPCNIFAGLQAFTSFLRFPNIHCTATTEELQFLVDLRINWCPYVIHSYCHQFYAYFGRCYLHWLFLWRKGMHCCGKLIDMTWHNLDCVNYSNPCHKGWWLPCSATLFILHHFFPTLNCLLTYWMTWFTPWSGFHH